MNKDQLINDMLKNIKDQRMRDAYGKLLSGETAQVVKCNSDVCKGRVIATISPDGSVTETQPELDPKGKYGLYKSGLEGSRQRFDGQLGFRCYCGNNSILCIEEQGVLNPAAPVPPTEDDLLTIAERLSKRKVKLPAVGPRIEVDGFTIEDVRV